MEKWDQYHEDKRIKKKKQDVEMWEETVGDAAQNKIHMKGWVQLFPQKESSSNSRLNMKFNFNPRIL